MTDDDDVKRLRELAEAVITATGDQIMPLPADATMREVGERRARRRSGRRRKCATT